MHYDIQYQPSYSLATIHMEQGEQFMAEAGAMVSMSPTIKIDAALAGKSVFGAMKSAVGGESIFRTTFTAERGPGQVALAPQSTGDITVLELNAERVLVQPGSYLAGPADLEISIQGSLRGMLSGEGLFLLDVRGSGPLFVSSFGAIHAVELQDGEEYIVDTSHIVAFDDSVHWGIEKAAGKTRGVGGFLKGMVKSAMSGEGFVCRYRGPGRIYIQTRSLKGFASTLIPFMPTRSK